MYLVPHPPPGQALPGEAAGWVMLETQVLVLTCPEASTFACKGKQKGDGDSSTALCTGHQHICSSCCEAHRSQSNPRLQAERVNHSDKVRKRNCRQIQSDRHHNMPSVRLCSCFGLLLAGPVSRVTSQSSSSRWRTFKRIHKTLCCTV